MSRILVVDDEPAIVWGLREYLQDLGHRVWTAGSAEAALQLIGASQPETILLDVRLPGMDGLTALPEIRRHAGEVPVIVMTAFGDLDTAVRSVEQGAFDYLTKPFDLEEAGVAVDRALRNPATSEPLIAEHGSSAPALLGSSPAMQNVFKQIALVAGTEVPVLITGETGTGKELTAQAIHRHSSRRDGPFVPVCLAALSPSVVESELFGHVRGAFTGAHDERPGLLDLANGGTLFLDEIGDTPLALQVKLLRFLETRQFSRVGSGQPRTVNVRVVAATNRRLPEMIEQGEFRDDLMFRLRGFEIALPPLRERGEDIGLLAEAFLARMGGYRVGRLDAEFLAALHAREWVGNVRELRSAIEHAAIRARSGPLLPQHLPAELGRSPVLTAGPTSLSDMVAEWAERRVGQLASETDAAEFYREFLTAVEPSLLTTVLRLSGDNRAAAARLLGLDRTTLRGKLRAYGIDPDSR